MQEQERNKLQLEGGDQDLTLTNGNNIAMILRKAGGSWRNGADDKSLRKSVMAKLYKLLITEFSADWKASCHYGTSS